MEVPLPKTNYGAERTGTGAQAATSRGGQVKVAGRAPNVTSKTLELFLPTPLGLGVLQLPGLLLRSAKLHGSYFYFGTKTGL